MVTDFERKVVLKMLGLGAWHGRTWMRNTWIEPRPGFRWLLIWLKKRQIVDDLHHAPACNANHWHKQRLVFRSCNCGAAQMSVNEMPPHE